MKLASFFLALAVVLGLAASTLAQHQTTPAPEKVEQGDFRNAGLLLLIPNVVCLLVGLITWVNRQRGWPKKSARWYLASAICGMVGLFFVLIA